MKAPLRSGATLVILCLALAPLTGQATIRSPLSAGKGWVKRAKRVLSEIVNNPAAYVHENWLPPGDLRWRDIERNLSTVMLPVTARTLGILPWEAESLARFAEVGMVTVFATVGDWVGRTVLRRSNSDLNARYWEHFGSESPFASFVRGAYGGLGISTLGLGIILPIATGGQLLYPEDAATIIAGTSLALGTLRATAKVIGNRERAEDDWLGSTEDMVKRQ